MTDIRLNPMQLDALREINSIGAGNAATALSVMLHKKVDIGVPEITMEAAEKVADVLGGEEKIANIVCLSVRGPIPGSMLMVFSPSDSLKLCDLLTGRPAGRIRVLDDMGISALKELGNIIAGAYLSALAKMMRFKITYSVPEFVFDMLGSVLKRILARASLKAGYVMIVESEFKMEESIYRIHLVFIFVPDALKVMLEALAMQQK